MVIFWAAISCTAETEALCFRAMLAAGLGLACRESFAVFSQYETLRLQSRVHELEREVETLKTLFMRQLERIEWAGDVMWRHDIRCGCVTEDCDFCGDSGPFCTCLIHTCECGDCVNHLIDKGDKLVAAGLIRECCHRKGQRVVRGFGSGSPRAYYEFEASDPEWYRTLNVMRWDIVDAARHAPAALIELSSDLE